MINRLLRKSLCALTLFGVLTPAYSQAEPTVYLVGDSTMAIKREDARPETGWGEAFLAYLKKPENVSNRAVNGRSTKSFRDEGRWQSIVDNLQKGDLVFIQFGHNDQKSADPARFTNPYTGYRFNLKRYVEETRAKGATPLLLSSIIRRNFNESGTLIDTHAPYPAVMRELAGELEVDFVDLNLLTEQLVIAKGVDESLTLYNHLEPGESDNYPEGVADDTHLSPAGAEAVAGLAASALCQLGAPYKNLLKTCKK